MKKATLFIALLSVVFLFIAPAFSEGPNIELYQAMATGDVAKVKAMLDANPKLLTEKDPSTGGTLLHTAVVIFNMDIMKLIISKGADINAGDQSGITPLHMAVITGNVEASKLLLDKGADPNKKDGSGRTPTHYAQISANAEILNLLVQRGGKIDPELDAAIKSAQDDSEDDAVVPDAPYEVDKNTANSGPARPSYGSPEYEIYSIIHQRDLKSLQEKISKDPKLLNMKLPRGVSLLHEAASTGALDICKYLAEKGLAIDAKDELGRTPLELASETGSEEVCYWLISKGVNVNSMDNENGCPLTEAVYYGHQSIVRLFILKGAKINIKDKNGITPLHMAASKGDLEMSEILIEAGAEIDAKDANGRTPLHHAVQGYNPDLIVLLIKKGADVNARDNKGVTPKMLACDGKGDYDPDVCESIKKSGGK